jgi:hypothetical protein
VIEANHAGNRRRKISKSDVVNAFRLWLLYELFRGWLSEGEGRSLIKCIKPRGSGEASSH